MGGSCLSHSGGDFPLQSQPAGHRFFLAGQHTKTREDMAITNNDWGRRRTNRWTGQKISGCGATTKRQLTTASFVLHTVPQSMRPTARG